jgi:hypothetical protein
MDINHLRNSNFFGVNFHYSSRELMMIESRRTRIEALKREMGDKYLLTPLYTKLRKPLK